MKGLSSGLVIGLTILLVFAACLAVLVALLFVQRSRRAQIERNLSFVDTTTSTINSLNVDLEKLKSAANDSNFSCSSLKLASPYTSVNSVGTGLTLVSNEAIVHGDDSSANRSMKSGRSHGLPSSPSSPRKSKMYHYQSANAPRSNGLPSSPRKSRLNVTIPNHQTPSIRRLSSQEILAHHTANGTMTRPFAPLPPTTSDPDVTAAGSPYIHQNLTTAQISRSSIITNRRRSSLYLSTSAGEGDPNIDDPNLSSISIVSEASSARVQQQQRQQQRPQPNVLKVRTIFTPLLPDELVLRPNEKLTLIKNCSDGWCIVGRKSPFYVPSPVRKEFGQRNTERPDEIEIGAVPAWVFENNDNGNGKENVPGERPLRSESLSVVITMGDDDEVGQREKEKGKERKDVISWSNVY
ncbi:hypothetical protein Clacol_003226 [Clathrus columnatus]|uniref:SH3 domain-containing protein n=1 Tax=Clathrus columnatus TaxID=1419009 RepID=A0AAV5A7P6_9AGAM|nr:hypothetical protein Clacol_003226 [Clathrus columnatus]